MQSKNVHGEGLPSAPAKGLDYATPGSPSTSRPSPSFMQRIQQHTLLRRMALEGEDAYRISRERLGERHSLMAIDSFSLLFLCDVHNDLNVVSLKRLKLEKDDQPQHSTTLCLSPPLGFEVRSLSFNAGGDFLLAVGKSSCAVVQITERTRREILQDKQPQEVECRSFPIGNFFHSTQPSLCILKAAWHPLSNSHVVVLTSDNTLRIYDLATDIEEPEQTFRLYSLIPSLSFASVSSKPSNAIDLCFGSSKLTWDRFTIYFLMEDGGIYGLCPVLPYNCILPEEILSELKTATKVKLEQVETARREQQLLEDESDGFDDLLPLSKRYHVQLKWLDQVKGRTIAGTATGAVHNTTDKDRQRNENLATKGWIVTRKPFGASAFVPVLQGPLNPVDDASPIDPKKDRACCLASIQSTSSSSSSTTYSSPLVLVKAYASGWLEIFLSFDEIEAEWDKTSSFFEEVEESHMLLLYERLNLRLPDLYSGIHVEEWKGCDLGFPEKYFNFFHPFIFVDKVHSDSLYITHISGMHCVKLEWLPRLETYCPDISNDKAAQAPALDQESLPDLPRSMVHPLLQTMPLSEGASESAPVIGVAVVNDPSLGHFLLALTCSYQCVCLPRPIFSSYFAPLQEKLITQREGEEQQRLGSFLSQIEPLLSKTLPSMPKISTPDPSVFSFSSPQALDFLVEACSKLRQHHVLHIHHIHTLITKRIEMLCNLKERQDKDIGKLHNKLEAQREKEATIQAKLEEIAETQERLTAQSEALLNKINSSKPTLSAAEKDYHRVLRAKKDALQFYRAKIEKLRTQTEKLLHEQEQQQAAYTISDSQLKKIEPILQNEVAMIAETVDGMKKLQLRMKQDFPDLP